MEEGNIFPVRLWEHEPEDICQERLAEAMHVHDHMFDIAAGALRDILELLLPYSHQTPFTLDEAQALIDETCDIAIRTGFF